LDVWNSHRIRQNKWGLASGRPAVMFEVPALYGTSPQHIPLTPAELDSMEDKCARRSLIPCDADIHKMCCRLMRSHGYSCPNNQQTGLKLYFFLRGSLRQMLGI
jgi:hypothetical protein